MSAQQALLALSKKPEEIGVEDARVLLEEVARLQRELDAVPFEAMAVARFYASSGPYLSKADVEFWSCLRCGCEWPAGIVTACANCHAPG